MTDAEKRRAAEFEQRYGRRNAIRSKVNMLAVLLGCFERKPKNPNGKSFFNVLVMPLDTCQVPFVKPGPAKKPSETYEEIDPANGPETKWAVVPGVVCQIRSWSKLQFAPMTVMTVRGVFYNVARNRDTGEVYASIRASQFDENTEMTDPVQRWKAMAPDHRLLHDKKRIADHHRTQMEAILGPELAARQTAYAPNGVVAFELDQSYNALNADARLHAGHPVGRVARNPDGHVWTRKYRDREASDPNALKPPVLCFNGLNKAGQPMVLDLSVMQKATDGPDAAVETHQFAFGMFESDLAALALVTRGQAQAFNREYFGEYGPQLVEALQGVYIGSRRAPRKRQEPGADEAGSDHGGGYGGFADETGSEHGGGSGGGSGSAGGDSDDLDELFGHFFVDVAAVVRRIGMRIPAENVTTLVPALFGLKDGTTLPKMSKEMAAFKAANHTAFGTRTYAANLNTLEGDIGPLLAQAASGGGGQAEFWLATPHMEDIQASEPAQWPLVLKSNVFSVFCLTTGTTSIESMLSGNKRQRMAGE